MSGGGFLDNSNASPITFDEIGFAHFDWQVLAVMAARMGTAALIAAVVAYRWWRPFLPGHFERTESGAQVLISVAGAMMVQVVGTNTALAFALVGLGGFIRFRSGIKDPREAGVMFLMIGIGMAAGIGNMPVALVAAIFGIPLLIVLDYGETRRRSLARRRVRFGSIPEPRKLEPDIRSALEKVVNVRGSKIRVRQEEIVIDFIGDKLRSAGEVVALLEARGIKVEGDVSCEEI
jgi:hypothetical protein